MEGGEGLHSHLDILIQWHVSCFESPHNCLFVCLGGQIDEAIEFKNKERGQNQYHLEIHPTQTQPNPNKPSLVGDAYNPTNLQRPFLY